MMISEKASNYVKVILSADAGDEVFGGYDKHVWTQKIGRLTRSPIWIFIKAFLKVSKYLPEFILSKVFGSRNPKERVAKLASMPVNATFPQIMQKVSQYISDDEIGNWLAPGVEEQPTNFPEIQSEDIDNHAVCGH